MKDSMQMNRRSVLAGGLSAAALAFAAPYSLAAARRSTLPDRRDFLIQGATIVSVDPDIGVIRDGHILVRDGVIVAVGPGAGARAERRGAKTIDGRGFIASPGFIDTHWHVWTSIFKNFIDENVRDGDASSYLDYGAVRDRVGRLFTPEDSHISAAVGLAEACNAGVTSVLNYAHNNRTPAHADAEIQAHLQSGLRTLYCFGAPNLHPRNQPMDLADLRTRAAYWSSREEHRLGIFRIGASLRATYSTREVFEQEMRAVLDLDLPATLHGGRGPALVDAVQMLKDGYLNSKTVMVHYAGARDVDRAALKQAGSSLSWSVLSEISNARRYDLDAAAQILQMAADGINISLSVDGTPISALDMFENMRALGQYAVPIENDPRAGNLKPFTNAQLLQFATINGARTLGLGDITGSLRPGKRADIILTRETDINMSPAGGNPVAKLVLHGQPANIDTVIADGRILKRGGRLVGIDAEAIRVAANASALRIRREIGFSNP